jgi:hypothetical protein
MSMARSTLCAGSSRACRNDPPMNPFPTSHSVGVRVRRELEVPLQRAALWIERHDRIRVQVVTEPIVADQIRTRIAHGPVHEIELRIVRTGHPRGPARMLEAFPLH